MGNDRVGTYPAFRVIVKIRVFFGSLFNERLSRVHSVGILENLHLNKLLKH